MEEGNNPRKRSRVTSPPPSHDNSIDGNTIARRLKVPSQRNEALNHLLRITASHEVNYCLDGDSVLQALVCIFFEVVGWDRDCQSTIPRKETAVFNVKQSWIAHCTKKAEVWARFCEEKLSTGRLSPKKSRCLEVILMIFRNLSFVAANLRLLAYSPDVLSILTGSLYENTSIKQSTAADDTVSGSTNILTLSALHALVNLSPYLDLTGQKLVCDRLFLSTGTGDDSPHLPSPESFGQLAGGSWGFAGFRLAKRLDTKEDIVQDVTKDMMLQLSQDYLVCIWSIFPALVAVLTDSTAPRPVIIMAVDLLQEFVNQARAGMVGDVADQNMDIPNARSVLVNVPDQVLQRLIDLLYIPRLGPDALEYIDPVRNIVTRVTTLKLVMGYEATVDTDVRDRALELLVPLVELDSPRLAKKLGLKKNGKPQNRLYDAVFPILAGQAGRSEAPQLATQLLRELSKARETRIGCLHLQERIISLASNDPRVAHLAFNDLLAQRSDIE